MRFFSSKRRVVAALLVVLALFLIRPGASQLKSRIIRSISAGVGRPADIGAVHIRLLPRPGFDLDNLVVYDDPAFGAEPILRASEVTADLRLTSLVRGRLEIARLDLTEPSLNLVHQPDGRWNLEALLERTAQLPLAPTAKAKSEPRPAFPYIEGSSGRINFKFGAEKKPYALTNADFALWQDSENSWGVRLQAQPFRSDLNLSDTGQLQVNGTWQRARSLRETPLEFSIEWSRAQLGQATKFFTGSDKGWRGTVQLDVAVNGTPAQLQIAGDGSLDDFRRYDITSGNALRMHAHCDAEYSSATHEFHQVICNAPVGEGFITLTGDMGLPGSHRYSVAMTAQNVPAGAAVILAERSKKNLPDDLAAQGTIHADVSMREEPSSGTTLQVEGRGEIAGFHLSSVAIKSEAGPETVPFLFTNSPEGRSHPSARTGSGLRIPDGPRLEIGPIAVGGSHAGAATLRGWVNRGGYSFAIAGETEIARMLLLGRMIGFPVPAATVDGSAQVDLQLAGSWAAGQSGTAGAGFAKPQVTGSAKLRNVHISIHDTGAPVVASSAELQLLPDKVRVAKLSASLAGSDWTGWLETPRGCGTIDACPVVFSLHASQVLLGSLREWISPNPATKAWYQVLESGPQKGSSPWANLRASGRVTTDRLLIRGVAASHVSADVDLAKANLEISNLQANFVGGDYRGTWRTDFGAKPGQCSGNGNLHGLSLTQVADAMKDPWISGSANASYELTGPCTADFWQTAKGTLRLDVQGGAFSHIVLADDGAPLHIRRLIAQADLRGGKLEITDANLDSPDGKYQLRGSISLRREVDFKFVRAPNGVSGAGYAVTGTLAEPRVAPLPGAEQARLKPLPK